MNQKFLLFFIAFASLKAFSQPSTPKSKTYPATQSWDFICENYALTGIAEIQVAKIEKGGLLKITIATTDPSYTISGTTYVFLTDNTIITCTDKAMREVSGDKITSYYTFSPVEITKLKTTEIESIHFNINGKQKGFSSQTGNFTALNRKNYFATTFDKRKKSYDTTAAITELYTK
jgi:hypothetical protein